MALVLIRLPGLFWGLPATDGWDNDGVAPRDFLPGLIQTFTPGEYYTYPPLHAALLAVVNLPVLLLGVITAPSLEPMAVRDHFLQPWLMTPIAVISRTVGIAFACVTMHATCTFATQLVGGDSRKQDRVVRWTAAALLCNVSLTYYGATTNLDGPYLAWACLAFLALARLLKSERPASTKAFVVYAAFAICTKDQAYAAFLLSVPVAFVAKVLSTPSAERRAWLLSGFKAAAGTLILVLCIDGALVNPWGFLARLQFLRGPASQEHGYYAKTWEGTYWCLRDVVAHWDSYYPYALAPLVFVGLWLAIRRAPAGRMAVILGCLPLFAALSFTIAFNVPAGRTEQRFVLPQSVWLTTYVGIAMAWAARLQLARLPLAAALAYAAWGVVGLKVSMWNDPRYAAEDWMRLHLAPGASVETYGENVYMPRFRPDLAITRVASTPIVGRNPVSHAKELQSTIGDAFLRAPEYIVLTEVWANRYLNEPPPNLRVRDLPRTNPSHYNAVFEDTGTHSFVKALANETSGYKRVAKFYDEPRYWQQLQMHASTSCFCGIWIYQRQAP